MKKERIKNNHFKIILSLILFFTLGINQLWTATCGDVDFSGSVNIIDALTIARYSINQAQINIKPPIAEVNGDGKIDIIDALTIARYYVGIIPSLPGCRITSTLKPIITPKVFYSIWDTTKTQAGTSKPNQIKLPILYYGKYNFDVDWGDGSKSRITEYNHPDTTHSYSEPGIYHLKITGLINGFNFSTFIQSPNPYIGPKYKDSKDAIKLLEIRSWGPLNFSTTRPIYPRSPKKRGYFFKGAKNLIITATDILDLTGVSNLEYMFAGCKKITTIPNMENWDVSNIIKMSGMFQNASSFNQDISSWDVSKVKYMNHMFQGATSFNQDIGNWDVKGVLTMKSMFHNASSFNQNIKNWDISRKTIKSDMFKGAPSFNQNKGN